MDELLGTKLRALYQRRKGRDLYDLFKAISMEEVDIDKVICCYRQYLNFVVDHMPTYKEFIMNMAEKLKDDEFLGDTKNLLRHEDVFDPIQGYEMVKQRLIDKMI